MKKIVLTLILFIFLACSKDDNQESYSFKNNTNFKVIVKPNQELRGDSPDFEFILNPKESNTYKSDYKYSLFEISSNETTRNFSYDFREDTRIIYDFGKMVEYKITGTATSADITYAGSSGNTVQRTVSLPHTVSFNYFANNFKYISAQNNTDSGSVRVELFIFDSFVSGKTCNSAYCIASTSN